MLLKISVIPLALIKAVEFPKDGDTDKHSFPPDGFLGASPGMPYGHLRPIGHQRRPLAEISKKNGKDIKLNHIYRDYIDKNEPVHLEKFFDLTDEHNKQWLDDEYFGKNFREMVVETISKVPGKKSATKPLPMRIGKFTDFYKHEDWYLVSTISEIMEKQTPLPPFLQCGPFPSVVEEVKLWFSYGMTSSHIHKDHEETLLCLLDGRKDIIFIEPDQNKYLQEFSVVDDIMGYTRLTTDADHINMFTEARIGRIGWKWATLRGGDCVYIPANQFHHIRSHGRALALSYHWEPLQLKDTSEFSDCSIPDDGSFETKPVYTRASSFNLKYRANIRGKRYIDLNHYGNPTPDLERFRADLLSLSYGKGYIEKEDFFKMWQLWAYNNSPQDYMTIAWSKLSQSMRSSKASTTRVSNLSTEDLGSLLKLLKKFHFQAIDPVGFRKIHDEL